MSGFLAWGLTLLGLAIVTTVAEMLLPQGKTRKVIRSVAATIAVFVIVTPLPNLLKSGFDFDLSLSDGVVTDEKYLTHVEGLKSDIIENALLEHLKTKGISGGFTVDVDLDGWQAKSATVNFSDFGITENGEHINKSEIIRLIAEYLRIGEEAVMAYG